MNLKKSAAAASAANAAASAATTATVAATAAAITAIALPMLFSTVRVCNDGDCVANLLRR